MKEEHEMLKKEEDLLNCSEKDSVDKFKVYRRRWAMLFLMASCNFCNSYHWISYAIVANIIAKYYSQPNWVVDWLALIFMLSYVILIFPATYFLDKKGLRPTVLLGIVGTTAGAWLKVLSISPERFYVAFLGQTMEALAFTCLFGLSPHLAAVWFGADEVSTAAGIGLMTAELGIAVGFMVPPWMLNEKMDLETTESQLLKLSYFGSIPPTILLVLTIFFFQKEPPSPPSKARALSQESKDVRRSYQKSLKNIMTNRGFVLLLVAYAMYHSVLTSILSLLGQIIWTRFPDSETDAGWLGNANTCAAIVGGVLVGVWLDKTHLFKASNLALYIVSVVGMLGFSYSVFYSSLPLTYIFFIVTGFFFGAYTTLGYEYGVELTYPEPEGTTSGLLNMACFMLTIVMTTIAGGILRAFGDMATNLFFAGTLGLGTIVSSLIRGEYKRLAASTLVTHPSKQVS